MNEDTRKIQAFAEEWLASAEPAPTELVIAHAPPGATRTSVLHTEGICAGKGRKKRDAGAIAEQLYGVALEHASATGGAQRYSVAAMAGDRVLGQLLFRLEAAPHGITLGDGELGGDAAGVVKHLLRHDERLHRLVTDAFEGVFAIQTRMLVDMGGRLENAQKQIGDTFVAQAQLVQELLDRRHERDLEAERARRKEERTDKMLDRLGNAVPMALASLSGSSPAAELLKTLTPEQFNAITSTLNDEQRELLRQVLELARGGEVGAERLLSGAPPEQEAAE